MNFESPSKHYDFFLIKRYLKIFDPIFVQQASEDAKKLVNQEKSFACAEIESARAVVLRIGEALEEQEKVTEASKPQVLPCCLVAKLWSYKQNFMLMIL